MVSTELQEKIRETVTIPTLPSTISRVREVMGQPNAGVADVAEIVGQDPPVASKVLRLANCTQYAPRQRIASIKHAGAILGMEVLERLVLEATLHEVFLGVETGAATDLWTHSILTAQTAQAIAKRSQTKSSVPLSLDELYTCGLVHDIGEFVLLGSLERTYLETLAKANSTYRELYLQEKEDLGYSHNEVGAMMAHLWRFPESLIEVIEWHHFPLTRVCTKPHVAVVVLADQVADLVQGRKLRSRGQPDAALLRCLQLRAKELDEVLRFAKLCLESIEV